MTSQRVFFINDYSTLFQYLLKNPRPKNISLSLNTDLPLNKKHLEAIAHPELVAIEIKIRTFGETLDNTYKVLLPMLLTVKSLTSLGLFGTNSISGFLDIHRNTFLTSFMQRLTVLEIEADFKVLPQQLLLQFAKSIAYCKNLEKLTVQTPSHRKMSTFIGLLALSSVHVSSINFSAVDIADAVLIRLVGLFDAKTNVQRTKIKFFVKVSLSKALTQFLISKGVKTSGIQWLYLKGISRPDLVFGIKALEYLKTICNRDQVLLLFF